MDYFAIIKKSYHLAIKNKFLWLFGLLAGGYGGFKGFGYFNSGSQTNFQGWDQFKSSLGVNNANFFTNNIVPILLVLGAIVVVIGIVCFILSFISQGALIGGGSKLLSDEKADLKISWRIGLQNFWKVLALCLTYFLIVLASLVVLVLPIVLFVIGKVIALAVVWGILFFLLCLLLWIVIGFISPYSLRIVVLEQTGVIAGIKKSFSLARANFVHILVMYLLLWVVNVAVGIALFLAVIIALLILLAIGLGLWLILPIIAVIYGILVAVAVMVALAIFSGAYNTFSSLVLTSTYQSLNKSK